MKCEVIRCDGDLAKLVLENVTPAVANAYRRVILSEVPILAVDEVIFFANTTTFFDEYIAHRLAMMPIRTDKKVYALGEDFTSRLKMDKTAEEDQEIAYSGELEASDPEIVPSSAKIPIAAMNRGERISFEAVVRLGTGRQHSKWQPVSGLRYNYCRTYFFKEDLCDTVKEIVKERGVPVEKEDNWTKVTSTLSYPELEGALLECKRKLGEEAVRINYDKSRILIEFEPTGALDCQDILLQAVDEVQKKFESFEAALREAASKIE